MPWRVEATSTPLWADGKRTTKKGIITHGGEFVVEKVEYILDQDMAKTSSVEYIRKGDGLTLIGDGWIELKNCVAVAPALPPEPEEEIAIAFLTQFRDALDVVLGRLT